MQARVAAGVDARKRLEINVDVQRHAVKTAAAAYAQTDARQFVVIDVDARRFRARSGFDIELGARGRRRFARVP